MTNLRGKAMPGAWNYFSVNRQVCFRSKLFSVNATTCQNVCKSLGWEFPDLKFHLSKTDNTASHLDWVWNSHNTLRANPSAYKPEGVFDRAVIFKANSACSAPNWRSFRPSLSSNLLKKRRWKILWQCWTALSNEGQRVRSVILKTGCRGFESW